MKRRHFCTAALASLAASHGARASTLPDGPLKLLVGFPPGGGTDIVGRTVAEQSAVGLARNVLVVNQPGASGLLAAETLRRAKPDGSMIGLAGSTTAVIAPLSNKNIDIDFVKDYEPIINLCSYSLTISVANSTGIGNWAEFVAWSKGKSAEILYGHGGAGSVAHLFGEMVGKELGLKLQHVPFKGGNDLVNALLGGHIEIGVNNTSEVADHGKAGRMRNLAVTSRKRAPGLPDVPTLIELGHPALECEPWSALFAPHGTPAAAILEWNKACNAALREKKVKDTFMGLGFIPTGGTPGQMRETITSDYVRWKKIIDSLNFTSG